MIKNDQAPSPEAFFVVLQFMAPSQSAEQPTCEEPYLDVDMEYQTWNIKHGISNGIKFRSNRVLKYWSVFEKNSESHKLPFNHHVFREKHVVSRPAPRSKACFTKLSSWDGLGSVEWRGIFQPPGRIYVD